MLKENSPQYLRVKNDPLLGRSLDKVLQKGTGRYGEPLRGADVTGKPSVATAISSILLWTRESPVREPGLVRKYGRKEEKGRNLSQVLKK